MFLKQIPVDAVSVGMGANSFPLWYGLCATRGGKLTASFARLPIANGNADVPNVARHGLFGLEMDW